MFDKQESWLVVKDSNLFKFSRCCRCGILDFCLKFLEGLCCTKEYLQKQMVPFLCWLFGGYINRRSFLKEARLHEAAILGSGMDLFISLA